MTTKTRGNLIGPDGRLYVTFTADVDGLAVEMVAKGSMRNPKFSADQGKTWWADKKQATEYARQSGHLVGR